MQLEIVVRSERAESRRLVLAACEVISFGRDPDSSVCLEGGSVSRNHALLVKRRDGLYLDDLGSLNGTYVNRRRIESHKLQNGDELQVGKYKLTYLER